MKSDKWNKLVLGIWLGVLVIIAGITAYIDPFFALSYTHRRIGVSVTV